MKASRLLPLSWPRAKTVSSTLISPNLIGCRSLKILVLSLTLTVTGAPPLSGATVINPFPTDVTLPATVSPGGMRPGPRSSFWDWAKAEAKQRLIRKQIRRDFFISILLRWLRRQRCNLIFPLILLLANETKIAGKGELHGTDSLAI